MVVIALVMEAIWKMESLFTGTPDESRVPNAPWYRTLAPSAAIPTAAGIFCGQCLPEEHRRWWPRRGERRTSGRPGRRRPRQTACDSTASYVKAILSPSARFDVQCVIRPQLRKAQPCSSRKLFQPRLSYAWRSLPNCQPRARAAAASFRDSSARRRPGADRAGQDAVRHQLHRLPRRRPARRRHRRSQPAALAGCAQRPERRADRADHSGQPAKRRDARRFR